MNSGYKKGEEESALIQIMKFIQWSHNHGGISLVYSAAGVLILTIYSTYSIFLGKGSEINYQALAIGISFCFIGMVFFFLNRKR